MSSRPSGVRRASEFIVASALDPLLHARTIKLVGSGHANAAAAELRCFPPCVLLEHDVLTDVAVIVYGHAHAARREQGRTKARAQSVVGIVGVPAAHEGRIRASPRELLLGAKGLIRTPCFEVGSMPEGAMGLAHPPASSETVSGRAAVIAQDTALAAALAAELASLNLPVPLCVGLGLDAPECWLGWLQAAVRSRGIDVVLLALSRTPRADWLVRALDAPARVVLLNCAERVGRADPARASPRLEHVARAWGWLCADTAAQALDAVWLCARGVCQDGPVGRGVLTLGETPACEELAVRAAARAGLTPKRPRELRAEASPGLVPPLSAIVSAGAVESPAGPEIPHFSITPRRSCRGTLAASQTTLEALSALIAVRWELAWLPDGAGRRSGLAARARVASGARTHLAAGELKALLAPFGLAARDEQLATSASSAATLARALGLPVRVRIVGPGLRDHESWGGEKPRVVSFGGVRQAFADVVHAARERFPRAQIDGVSVAPTLQVPITLDCRAHLWNELQVLVLSLGLALTPQEITSARCPIAPARARELADLVLEASAPPLPLPRARERRELGDFLVKLSQAATALAPDLRELHLKATLPSAGQPAIVLEASAVRAP